MSRSEFLRLADEADARKHARRLPPQLDVERLSKYVADSVTVGNDVDIPDCQTCGVCCEHDAIVSMGLGESHRLGAYIDITDDDDLEFVTDRFVSRDLAAGRCAHLSGEIGSVVSCGVYDRRPAACREFQAGSDCCREYRRMYGLDPQLSEAEVARFSESVRERKLGIITHIVSYYSEGVSVSLKASRANSESYVSTRKANFSLGAAIDGDLENIMDLLSYNPDVETWFHSDFIGMTLEAARELIAARNEQAVSD